jgi:hypothetical protein
MALEGVISNILIDKRIGKENKPMSPGLPGIFYFSAVFAARR